jgi:hypothetical protein
LPLGDEEPGFPGMSMKLEQKRYKRKLETFKKLSEAALVPDLTKNPSTADGPIYPFSIERDGPRSILTWERGPPPGTALTGYETASKLHPSYLTTTEESEVD